MNRPSALESQPPLITKPEGSLRASGLRFIVLVLISLVSFGASFLTFSAPALYYQHDYTSLLSFVPYIIFPLCGGAIVDKLGVRVPLVVFGGLVALGSIFLSSNYNTDFVSEAIVFVIGGIFVLVGSGCLLVAQAAIAAKWFRNKELALAIGAYLGVSKIASLLGDAILYYSCSNPGDRCYHGSVLFADPGNIQQLIFDVGVALSMVSLVSIIALFILDHRADWQDWSVGRNQGVQVQENPLTVPSGLQNYPLAFYLLASSFLIQGAFLSFDGLFFNALVNSWVNVTDQINAFEFYVWVGIAVALLFPVFGFIVDRFGKKTIYLLVSSLAFTIACVIVIIIMFNNEVDTTSLRSIYIFLDAIFQPTFLCVFWFCIPLVFDQKIMGRGVGIAICMTNLAAFTISGVYYFTVGGVYDDNNDQDAGITRWDVVIFPLDVIFMAIVAFIGTMFIICLYREDVRSGRKLANPSIIQMAKNSNSFATNRLL